MPDLFTSVEIQKIGKEWGGSPLAVKRICGALKISREGKETRVGLNLYDSSFFMGRTRDELVAETVRLLNAYRSRCPRVMTWLQRGDFNPLSVPESISAGALLHASRTAARLRAESLRKVSQTAL